jgi:hypothetical protein
VNDLWQAFRDGHQFVFENGRTVTMHSEDAGSLTLPTGRVVISDPFLDPWQPSLTTIFPPGTYPVHLALADEKPAVVMVLFAEGPPTRWARAKPSNVSVDSASAALWDHRVVRRFHRRAEAGKYERDMRRLEGHLDGGNGLWANAPLPEAFGGNVVLFKTWSGDGSFPIHIGRGPSEEPVCLVVDMLVRLTTGHESLA